MNAFYKIFFVICCKAVVIFWLRILRESFCIDAQDLTNDMVPRSRISLCFERPNKEIEDLLICRPLLLTVHQRQIPQARKNNWHHGI